jgi:nucleoside-diphosphate-sugar epimerase
VRSPKGERVTNYSGRGVLVIGGLGFIGINLTRRLLHLGASVTLLTPSRERHTDEAALLETSGPRLVEGDVRDSHLMARVVSGQQVIFNLSGQSGAVRSMEDPWTDLDVNLRGNLVLLEAIRDGNPDATLVLAGSRLQYGRPAHIPAAEDDRREPLCLHAIHKQTAEEYVRLYARLFGLRSSVARITNPFGPGQPPGRTSYGVINRLIHLAIEDRPLTLYGDGLQLRDYVFVDDVVEALLMLGNRENGDGRVYNVGSGTGTSMLDAARLIIDIAGSGSIQHVPWPPLAEQIETGDFVADISRIREEVGWTPRVALRDGIERTVAHYARKARRVPKVPEVPRVPNVPSA